MKPYKDLIRKIHLPNKDTLALIISTVALITSVLTIYFQEFYLVSSYDYAVIDIQKEDNDEKSDISFKVCILNDGKANALIHNISIIEKNTFPKKFKWKLHLNKIKSSTPKELPSNGISVIDYKISIDNKVDYTHLYLNATIIDPKSGNTEIGLRQIMKIILSNNRIVRIEPYGEIKNITYFDLNLK